MKAEASRVHLLYGLSGSGKTTLAKVMAAEEGAVRFTLDEWMLRLYPSLTFDSTEYGDATVAVKELIWSVAAQILVLGDDVILDWNSWSRARRDWVLTRASDVGAEVVLHVLETPAEVANLQAAERTRAGVQFSHAVTAEDNAHLANLMEPPTADEGLRVVRHSAGNSLVRRQ